MHALASPRLAALACALAVVCGTPGRAQSVEELFDPSQLHEIRLLLNSRDVQRLRAAYLENRYYAADLHWRDARVRNVAVRSRGGATGSRNPHKLGLLVEFDRYVTGQRFAGRRSLVLDNLWQDPSMVRERVAMALFARLGHPASLEAHARLYINGEYQGVYGVVETIDETFLARTVGDTQGSLYEFHWIRPYYFENLGNDLASYTPLFEARTNAGAAETILYQPIQEMVAAINEPSDTLWRDRVDARVDLPQLVTHVAIETFLSEWDGILGYAGMNNVYLHRPAAGGRHQFFPWDRDNAFREIESSIFQRVHENVLVRRALTYPDLYALFLDVLDQAAAAADGGWLENEIRSAAGVVAAGVVDDPRTPYTLEQHQQELAYLIDFARRRPGLVRAEVANARGN